MVMKQKVSQATIDKIKKMGMTKALKGASGANPEMKEALTRMYGARRVAAASKPVAMNLREAERRTPMKAKPTVREAERSTPAKGKLTVREAEYCVGLLLKKQQRQCVRNQQQLIHLLKQY
jgi:hypothetical protein